MKRLRLPSRLGLAWRALTAPQDVAARPAIYRTRPGSELDLDLGFVVAHYVHRTPTAVFVQVGAGDGRTGDPLFETVRRFGLRGLVVEPQPEVFDALRRNYSDCPEVILDNVAIAAVDGVRVLYRVRAGAVGVPHWANQLATFDRGVLLKQRRNMPNIDDLIEELAVPCLSLRSLLAKHGLERADILQVDAEGYDFQIVKMALGLEYPPPILNYEHRHLTRRDRTACLEILVDRGYRVRVGSYDTLAYRGGTVHEPGEATDTEEPGVAGV